MKRDKAADGSPTSFQQTMTSLSAPPAVRLRPGMAANAAARLLLCRLLQTMRANEAGILADADIEFLHEYRVAVRRTRAALSLIPKVFPPEETECFKRGFRELGRRTNDLRNLDVFLSAGPDYQARLPDDMKEDIAPLFDYLRSHRSEARDSVVAALQSKSYTRFLNEWASFLGRPAGENPPDNALRPVIELARRGLNRQYRTILKDGTSALEHPDDEHMHDLRIECKKLRYLLEFFATLYPPRKVGPLLKRLKRLQDNLGALSDLGDQRDYLVSVAEMVTIDGGQARRALIATGYLVERIEREQRSARAEFGGIFKEFASPAHQKQFQKLIK